MQHTRPRWVFKLAKLIPLAVVFGAILPGAAAQPAQLSIDSTQPEVVFSWQKQRCDDNTIPDSPARAMRLQDGRVFLIAAHYTNRILIGPSLSQLAINCQFGSRGDESADPSQFDDRYWIQALLRLQDGQILGFASHEYHGKRHPNTCSISTTQRVRCWYSSIVATELDTHTMTFRLVSLDHRVIAASPSKYNGNGPERSGFFTVSNIASLSNVNYLIAYQEGIGPGGNCLFRQSQPENPYVWEAWAPGGQWVRFANPYTEPAGNPMPCKPIGGGQLSHPLMSLFYLQRAGKWIGVFSGAQKDKASGVYYSTTSNLLDWSIPALLLASSEERDNPGKCGIFYSYPSLLDARSKSIYFDSGGDDLWLYVTRSNLSDCHSYMDRDLVRFKVNVAL